MTPRPDVYVSVDIEADGPIPGPNSMLSFGFAVAATFDGVHFEARDPRQDTFYRELRPISDTFDREALAVSGIDRDRLIAEGEAPDRALKDATRWISEVAGSHRAVLVAWPLAYDWLFVQWYFLRFTSGSPFGFSSCLDMKTMFWRHRRTVLEHAGKDDLPAELRAAAPHTHNALDDAIEQAEIFQRLWNADARSSR